MKNTKLTKESLMSEVQKLLTPSELALLNFNIYANPEHIDYYMDYHAGKYDKCYDFLIKNRHLLTIEHTPEKSQEMAKIMIKNAEIIFGKK